MLAPIKAANVPGTFINLPLAVMSSVYPCFFLESKYWIIFLILFILLNSPGLASYPLASDISVTLDTFDSDDFCDLVRLVLIVLMVSKSSCISSSNSKSSSDFNALFTSSSFTSKFLSSFYIMHTKYISADDSRDAFGLTAYTFSNICLATYMTFLYSLDLNIFVTKFPPFFKNL